MQFSLNDELQLQQVLAYKKNASEQPIQVLENQRYKWLTMDEVVHSVMDKLHPQRLVLPHLHSTAIALALLPQPRRFLELGLGGGSMLRFLAHYFPAIEIDTVELNDVVIDYFGQYFNPKKLPCSIYFDDANQFIQQAGKQYDWIYVDLFSGGSNPDFLLKPEFYNRCWQKLSANGILQLNLIPGSDRDLPRILGIVSQFTDAKPVVAAVHNYRNQLVFVTKGPIDEQKLEQNIFSCCKKYQLDLDSFVIF